MTLEGPALLPSAMLRAAFLSCLVLTTACTPASDDEGRVILPGSGQDASWETDGPLDATPPTADIGRTPVADAARSPVDGAIGEDVETADARPQVEDGAMGAMSGSPDPHAHEATDERCGNGVDDDGDGQVDCEDRHCSGSPAVTVCDQIEGSDDACNDGRDNDGDGYVDCRDHDCDRNPWVVVCSSESSDAQCADGIDNDGNGFVDCEDHGCSRNDLVSVCAEHEAGFCLDGLDNDGDGDADCADLDCAALPCGERQIVVLTWNVRRFFDTVCESGACDDDAYEQLPTPDEFVARANQVAEGIGRVGPDVIVLQEIETAAALDGLHQLLPPEYRIAVIGETPDVDVAVIAKGAFTSVSRHRQDRIPLPGGGTTRFTREFLEVHLALSGARIVVFAAHFKSKRRDDPARRLAEAQAAQRIATDAAVAYPNALVLLAGDLNDTPGSPPLDALEAGGRLRRVAADVPPEEAYTTRFGRAGAFIDHIYLATDAAGRYVPGSARVHRTGENGYQGSDHAAVTARFDLP